MPFAWLFSPWKHGYWDTSFLDIHGLRVGPLLTITFRVIDATCLRMFSYLENIQVKLSL